MFFCFRFPIYFDIKVLPCLQIVMKCRFIGIQYYKPEFLYGTYLVSKTRTLQSCLKKA